MVLNPEVVSSNLFWKILQNVLRSEPCLYSFSIVSRIVSVNTKVVLHEVENDLPNDGIAITFSLNGYNVRLKNGPLSTSNSRKAIKVIVESYTVMLSRQRYLIRV